jgi:hypothetical protein
MVRQFNNFPEQAVLRIMQWAEILPAVAMQGVWVWYVLLTDKI